MNSEQTLIQLAYPGNDLNLSRHILVNRGDSEWVNRQLKRVPQLRKWRVIVNVVMALFAAAICAALVMDPVASVHPYPHVFRTLALVAALLIVMSRLETQIDNATYVDRRLRTEIDANSAENLERALAFVDASPLAREWRDICIANRGVLMDIDLYVMCRLYESEREVVSKQTAEEAKRKLYTPTASYMPHNEGFPCGSRG